MRIVIISNPIAGRGRARAQVEALASILTQRGHTVDSRFTTQRGDARRFASEIDPQLDRLIVAGGDGTLNEALNGLVDPGRVPIVPWAMGTANILARELRLPRDKPEPIADLIEHGDVRRLDMGVIGERRFLSVVSAGFDATVIEELSRVRRGVLGMRGYFVPIVRTLRRYRWPRLHVTVDGGERATGSMVVVSNIRNYAALFSVADRADCCSGHLDACVLHRPGFLPVLSYAMSALRKRLSQRRDVTYLTGHEIRIESDEPVAVEVDGDEHDPTPAVIRVQPGAVPIVTPPATSPPVPSAPTP